MKHPLPHQLSAALAAITLLALAAAFTPATAQAQQGGVAVLDIDKVAEAVGVQEDVKQALKEIEDNLNNQLRTIQTELQARFDNVKAQVGPQPTQEQAEQLANISGQLTQQLTQSRTQAQTQLNAKQFELVNNFRDSVKPVALEIAKAKGLGVVVTPDQSLFAWDESVDITEAVTAKMVEILPKRTAPATEGAAAPATEGAAPAATPATPEAP